MPTLGFGPARESDAHVVDERLELQQLLAAAQGYKHLLEAVLSA